MFDSIAESTRTPNPPGALYLVIMPGHGVNLSGSSALIRHSMLCPLKQKKELERPRPSRLPTDADSVQPAIETTASAMETASPPVASTTSEQDRASVGLMTAATPHPSSSAEVVGQLEAWLRTIEARRQDRVTTDESHHKVS